MDGDEVKIIGADSLENGAGWRSYVAICEEVQCIEDANLIAAAPDLLEALQLLLKQSKNRTTTTYPEWYGAVNKGLAAIRKALGKMMNKKYIVEVIERNKRSSGLFRI